MKNKKKVKTEGVKYKRGATLLNFKTDHID